MEAPYTLAPGDELSPRKSKLKAKLRSSKWCSAVCGVRTRAACGGRIPRQKRGGRWHVHGVLALTPSVTVLRARCVWQ